MKNAPINKEAKKGEEKMKKNKLREYKGKRWEQFGENLLFATVISGAYVSPAQNALGVFRVERDPEAQGEFILRQVYPVLRAWIYRIRGYRGPLGRECAELLAARERDSLGIEFPHCDSAVGK